MKAKFIEFCLPLRALVTCKVLGHFCKGSRVEFFLRISMCSSARCEANKKKSMPSPFPNIHSCFHSTVFL